MFEWFINVRGALKESLLITMFRTKCQQVYSKWLKQQPQGRTTRIQQALDKGLDGELQR